MNLSCDSLNQQKDPSFGDIPKSAQIWVFLIVHWQLNSDVTVETHIVSILLGPEFHEAISLVCIGDTVLW